MLQFVVLDVDSPYNAFLGRPALAEFRVCIAPWCLLLKFPTEAGTGVMRGDQVSGRGCYVAELRLNVESKDASSPSKGDSA